MSQSYMLCVVTYIRLNMLDHLYKKKIVLIATLPALIPRECHNSQQGFYQDYHIGMQQISQNSITAFIQSSELRDNCEFPQLEVNI